MNMRAKLTPEQQMTIPEFLAFTDTRPDGERWELIEGVAVMSPSPIDWHQVIVTNIGTQLSLHKERLGAAWTPMVGTGMRVPLSPNSLPQPDVLVKVGPLTGTAITDDAIVVFEVLSRANRKAHQAWRRRVYPSIPVCQHYVTVSMKALDVTVYSRRDDWAGNRIQGLDAVADLDGIGVTLPLRRIYRWTPLAP